MITQKADQPMDTQVIQLYQRNSNDQSPSGPQRSNNGSNGSNGGSPPNNNRRILNLVLLIAGIVLIFWVLPQLFSPGANVHGPNVGELTYSAFYQQIQAGNIKDATFQRQDVTGDFKHPVSLSDANGNPVLASQYHLTQFPNGDPNLIPLLNQYHVQFQVKAVANQNLLLTNVVNFLPLIVVFGVIFFISRRATQSQQNIFSFGKTRSKVVAGDRPDTAFADVAGVNEAKNDLVEVVEFLKTPGKFQRLGGKIPRGVLLVGHPGTGKTLLARAVAGEASVPFFSMSGSEFVEVLVGVGASRVRDLFDQAKKAAPSIIFIDEVDAVGRRRGASINSNDGREQTLNQLLVEMDGFDTRQAVVVIAATNRPDGLDQALLRPGRFDRRVTVDRPDWNGRLAILKIHSRNVPLAPDIDLLAVARATPGMVGADLANLVNEAALLAARRNLDSVNQQCFSEALDKILLGAERPLVLSDEDLNVIAHHEGGHALTGLLSEYADPVTKVTIVPRGQALGVTMSTPIDDRYNYSKEYLQTQLVTALGGRSAEEIAIGHITTGAENDLQRVTALARQMVTRWGMSEKLGTISFSERGSPFMGGGDTGAPSDYSEQTAELIDDEVERIVGAAHERALELLRTHLPTLDRIAEELRKNEVLDARQLHQIMEETGAVVAAKQPLPQGVPQVLTPPLPPDTMPIPPEIQ